MAAFAAFLGFVGAAVDILMILVLNLLLDWNVGVLLNLEMGFRRAISAAIFDLWRELLLQSFGESGEWTLFGVMGVRVRWERIERWGFYQFADCVMESHPMEICVFE